MTTHYDAIIVGGGHNGLTCGAYLERVLGMPGGHELHGEVASTSFFSNAQRPITPIIAARSTPCTNVGLLHIPAGRSQPCPATTPPAKY